MKDCRQENENRGVARTWAARHPSFRIGTGALNGEDKLLISKSKYLCGNQCHKLLWHVNNSKDLIPPPDVLRQALFDQGREVGQLAQRLYPHGMDVAIGMIDFEELLLASLASLSIRKPLFGAAFTAHGAFCRVDILVPNPVSGWCIVEVKSTTSIKDFQLHDVAFQAWVLTKAGLLIQDVKIININPDYVRSEVLQTQKLFTTTDVTAEVAGLVGSVGERVSRMVAVIHEPKPPDARIGFHCDDPYRCPLHDLCWKFLPKRNVLGLYRGKGIGFQLLEKGIHRLKEIPADFKLTLRQQIQRSTAISSGPHVARGNIEAFIKQLRFPVHFLDFETFATAIPLFSGLRPYQQVPFQFSLHILGAPCCKPKHRMFLSDGHGDPRRLLMKQLRDAITDRGSIVAFNTAFERARLKECSDFLPEFSHWVDSLQERFIDLFGPFREFHYYHPDQCGSTSMKAVLPALVGKGYQGLAIQDGSMASLEFLRVNFTDVSDQERQRVRRHLVDYCGRDTEGMIWIVDALRSAVGA